MMNGQETKVLPLFGKFSSVFAAFLYGFCSVAMALVNKALLTSLEFDFPAFIMVIQMLFTILVLQILSLLGFIQMPPYTLERGKSFALPALFYGLNSMLALSALSHMNIALYGVLKRCGPMVTMVLSVIILKKGWPSKLTTGSVLALTIGCIIAGFGDLSFNAMAYLCGALSNLAQAIYLILVQKATDGKMSMVESLQLNSINTLPLLVGVCIYNEEFVNLQKYEKYSDVSFIVTFFIAISCGCLLNYALFLCTSLTSALTTSVVGGLKALAQTLIGIFTFGGVSNNLPTVVGISMSVTGGISYLFAKYRESVKSKKLDSCTDLRKIMSFSTSEDLKMENGISQANGRPLLNGTLPDGLHDHRK